MKTTSRVLVFLSVLSSRALAQPVPPAAPSASTSSTAAAAPSTSGAPAIILPGAAPPLPPVDTSVGSMSLDELVRRLRASHPMLTVHRARVRAARAVAVGAGLWTNPMFDASYTAAVRNSSYDRVGAPVFGLTQFLELSGAPAARRHAAELEAEATVAESVGLERQLLTELTVAYFAYAEALERWKAQHVYLRSLERVAALVNARVDGGLSPRYDATRLALAMVDARAAVTTAQAEIHRAYGALSIAAGTEIPPEGSSVDLDVDATIEVPVLSSVQRGVSTSPWMQAAQHRSEAAEASIEAARRSVWPGVGVRLGGGYGQAPGQIDVSIGLVVPLPVLDRGQGAISGARAVSEQASAEAMVIDRVLREQLRTAHAELSRRVAALDAFRAESQPLLSLLCTQAEVGYKDGRLSAFELIEAYQSVRDARVRQVELVVGALSAKATLRRLGG